MLLEDSSEVKQRALTSMLSRGDALELKFECSKDAWGQPVYSKISTKSAQSPVSSVWMTLYGLVT